MTTTEADDLAAKLENYVLQLRQVEAALDVDPTHVELLKIKGDLNELIYLTRNILREKIVQGVPLTKSSRVSNASNATATNGSENAATEPNAMADEYQAPSPFSQEAEDSDLCNVVIGTCMAEMKPELDSLKNDLQAEDLRYCAMLHYWRKNLAGMRLPDPDGLNIILPTKTLATLSKLRNVTEVEVEEIMKKDKCFNDYNKDQARIILKILTEGESCFERIVKSFCNRCAGRGHIAKICTRPIDKKAVNEYYKKNHPEMIARQQKRRRQNSLRNKRLRRDEAAAFELERKFETVHDL